MDNQVTMMTGNIISSSSTIRIICPKLSAQILSTVETFGEVKKYHQQQQQKQYKEKHCKIGAVAVVTTATSQQQNIALVIDDEEDTASLSMPPPDSKLISMISKRHHSKNADSTSDLRSTKVNIESSDSDNFVHFDINSVIVKNEIP